MKGILNVMSCESLRFRPLGESQERLMEDLPPGALVTREVVLDPSIK